MAEEINSGPARQWGRPEEECCGLHAAGNAGKALVNACVLCPRTSVYYGNEPGFQARLAANPDAYPGFIAGATTTS